MHRVTFPHACSSWADGTADEAQEEKESFGCSYIQWGCCSYRMSGCFQLQVDLSVQWRIITVLKCMVAYEPLGRRFALHEAVVTDLALCYFDSSNVESC